MPNYTRNSIREAVNVNKTLDGNNLIIIETTFGLCTTTWQRRDIIEQDCPANELRDNKMSIFAHGK